MKMSLFVTLALFFFFGWVRQEPAQPIPQEREVAKMEIGEVVNAIFRSLERMDVEALFQSYANSPDLVFFTTDGSMADGRAAKNHHAEWFKTLSSLNVTTVRDEFRFLPGNIVICAWQGRFEMTLKTGDRLKIDRFGITFIFRKIDNHWLVIYQHSSALPPVLEKPEK